jgi:glucokinase
MILAGDIGGTNARLAFFDISNGRPHMVSAAVFPSREYRSLDEIIAKFISSSHLRPEVACFGAAGPVRNGRVETTNLPWIIEAKALSNELQLKKVALLNDLEANAWGIAALQAQDFATIIPGKGNPAGNQAVIAAGTGLGEAGMYWDGEQYHIFATEGGHGDFAPRNELETELLRYLTIRFGHVSYERIVSGPGLVNIFQFLRDSGRGHEPEWLTDEMLRTDPAPAISRAAMEGKCVLCEHALDVFVSIYAAEAGNLALKLMATGGVFLGGGIAPKLLTKLAGPLFAQNFASKGRMQSLLESMPVKVIVNDQTALMGAARYARVSLAAPTL